jgi:hypothetical protein
MPKSRLELRALPIVVAAYVVAPLVTVIVLWLAWYGPWAAPNGIVSGGYGWGVLLVGGVPACLIAELIFATPLLVGFSRWRWWWLNGWTACGTGFLIAFLPVFAYDAAAPAYGGDVGGVVLAVNGVRTAAGWTSLILSDAPWGLAGLAMALTFRLIAVRTRSLADEVPAPAS